MQVTVPKSILKHSTKICTRNNYQHVFSRWQLLSDDKTFWTVKTWSTNLSWVPGLVHRTAWTWNDKMNWSQASKWWRWSLGHSTILPHDFNSCCQSMFNVVSPCQSMFSPRSSNSLFQSSSIFFLTFLITFSSFPYHHLSKVPVRQVLFWFQWRFLQPSHILAAQLMVRSSFTSQNLDSGSTHRIHYSST